MKHESEQASAPGRHRASGAKRKPLAADEKGHFFGIEHQPFLNAQFQRPAHVCALFEAVVQLDPVKVTVFSEGSDLDPVRFVDVRLIGGNDGHDNDLLVHDVIML